MRECQLDQINHESDKMIRHVESGCRGDHKSKIYSRYILSHLISVLISNFFYNNRMRKKARLRHGSPLSIRMIKLPPLDLQRKILKNWVGS